MSSPKLWKTSIIKISQFLLIFILITVWIFSGWPQIWNNPPFPPKIQQAQAAVIAQYTGGLLVYADTVNVGTPKYKVFDDTTGFGAEQSASSVGSAAIEWIRVAASPVNDEWIIATRDAGDVIKAQVCTGVDGGVSCGTPTTITATAGTHGFRNYDVAYEQTSGDALLVYGTATIDALRKIEWTGGVWTGDAAITTTRTAGTVEWVELTSRPASNQIGIAYSDDADDVSAYRWSGTAVADEATAVITATAGAGNVRKFDVSFEGTSGDMLVAAPLAGAGTTATGQLVGTTWTIGTQVAPDNITDFIDLQEPNPVPDNDVAMIAHGVTAAGANTMEGYEWSGTGMVDGTVAVDTSATNWLANYQLGATAYVSATYYAAAVFSDITGGDDINWWTMNNAGTWTAQADNLRTRGTIGFVDLFDYPNLDKVLLISADANSDLWADTWDGTTPSATVWVDRSGGAALELSLASATTDVVDFAFRLAPIPTTYNQSAYRFFNNADSTDVGTALAAQDTAATLSSTGAAFRLRQLIHIGGGNLALSGETFKLQFSAMSGTCDTAFSGETYADVTGATVIAYKDNATPADGASLTANASDPTHGADTIVNQTYEELNNFTNSVAAIPSGQDGKWDFALIDNGATANTAYCLRAVLSTGTVLDTYTVIPQITTAAAAPAQTITFSLGATSLALGTLSPSAVTSGSHTITVGTNAANGVAVTYSGTTLTSGSNTITAMSTAAASSVGTEQFGINAKDNATPNVGLECSGTPPIAAAATGYATVDNFKFVSGETIVSSAGSINDTTCTISYIANITGATEAGSYATTLTYIATGNF